MRWRELAAKGRKLDIIDEVTTGSHPQLTGSGWRMADDARNYRGGCYWVDPAAGGQLSTATWRLDNPLLGRYRISIWYGGIPDGGVASDAPYTVKTRQGEYNFKIDQTQNTGRWNELGVFEDPIHNLAYETYCRDFYRFHVPVRRGARPDRLWNHRRHSYRCGTRRGTRRRPNTVSARASRLAPHGLPEEPRLRALSIRIQLSAVQARPSLLPPHPPASYRISRHPPRGRTGRVNAAAL